MSNTRERLAAHLVSLIDAYAAHHGISPSTGCARVIGDPLFNFRLREGKDFRVGTYDKVVGAYAHHWPDGLPWPEGVPLLERAG